MARKSTYGKRKHVSPGVYTSETEITTAVQSLGITKAGIVGEALRGPAFQRIPIHDWTEYVSYFGGTSPAKYTGSQYPKYELPYIAKEYLKKSQQLQVVRVLGLSGVNAGDAWIISAHGKNGTYTKDRPMVVAVLRSRGEHRKAKLTKVGDCGNEYEYDGIEYYVTNVAMKPSATVNLDSKGCSVGFSLETKSFDIDVNNYGTFTLVLTLSDGSTKNIAVSLNPNDKNYITKLLGTDPESGGCELYVEEIYDVALEQLIQTGELTTLGVIESGETTTDGEGGTTTDGEGGTTTEGEGGTPAAQAEDEPKDTEEAVLQLKKIERQMVVPKHKAVDELLTMDEDELTRKHVGKRYLYTQESEDEGLTVHVSANKGVTWETVLGLVGHIYTVRSYVTSDGTREYYYTEYVDELTVKESSTEDKEEAPTTPPATEDEGGTTTEGEGGTTTEGEGDTPAAQAESGTTTDGEGGTTTEGEGGTENDPTNNNEGVIEPKAYEFVASTAKNFETEYLNPEAAADKNTRIFDDAVECYADGLTYRCEKVGGGKEEKVNVVPFLLDLNNYREGYRYASTPWVVSELKGSAEHVEIIKLFRFHTISDGNSANTEVKVSIENIDPDEGRFDVVVRDFYDTDASPVVFERYRNCNLIAGDSNYIAYRIGSTDDSYETKSSYITVEVADNELLETSIPAGFLGYPTRVWSVEGLSAPYFKYNTTFDEDIRVGRQYFGVSNLAGIDADILSYKGVEAYHTDIPEGLTPCFHLDSRIFPGKPNADNVVEIGSIGENSDAIQQIVSVDGVSGYEWSTVGCGNTTTFGIEPRIGTEADMVGTIYEDKRARKFTVAFYGGWDGWDYYRTSRSNTDGFKYQKYRGKLDLASGHGAYVNVLPNPDEYGFEVGEKALDTDYYAYLAGVRLLANPREVDINILATPGIDYVNNTLLVGEILNVVEEERADSLYVVTTPDKPFGAGDSISDMYTPQDAVDNLDASELDSNYICSYYPWVKVYDADWNQYVFLPVTRDALRDMAHTDNLAQPWYASAGMNRGEVDAIKPRKTLKRTEEDVLYAGRLNPIAVFPDDGIRIWGDKNFQSHESVMNRISKRRLLLYLRKLVSIATQGLIFDPNDTTMGSTVRSAITPILDEVRQKSGIVAYRIEIDDSQERRDNLEIGVRILVKPVTALEWLDIEFAVTMDGTLFEE